MKGRNIALRDDETYVTYELVRGGGINFSMCLSRNMCVVVQILVEFVF